VVCGKRFLRAGILLFVPVCARFVMEILVGHGASATDACEPILRHVDGCSMGFCVIVDSYLVDLCSWLFVETLATRQRSFVAWAFQFDGGSMVFIRFGDSIAFMPSEPIFEFVAAACYFDGRGTRGSA